MKKDNYQDAYDDTQLLNAGTKGSGLQNDAFNDGQAGAFDASKYFRAEGSGASFRRWNVKGYFKMVAKPETGQVSLLGSDLKGIKALNVGDVIYNYGVTHSQNKNYAKVLSDANEYFISVNAFSFLKQVSVEEAQSIIKQKTAAKEEAPMNAAGAVLDKTAVAGSYKSLVGNVNDLKKSINGLDKGAALAYIKGAKKDLEAIEKLIN